MDLRDFREGTGSFPVADQTPFVLVGDLNIVRSGQPLTTVLTGDFIASSSEADSPPDWDGTPFTNANPYHNDGQILNWTWRDDTSEFDPGVLDFALYSDSVLTTANKFLLDSSTLTSDQLSDLGLEPGDVALDFDVGRFDHIPLVVDFRFIDDAAGDYNGNGIVDAADYTVWRDSLGSTIDLAADGNGNGVIEPSDATVWQRNFGNVASGAPLNQAVPEPSAFWPAWIAFLAFASMRPRR